MIKHTGQSFENVVISLRKGKSVKYNDVIFHPINYKDIKIECDALGRSPIDLQSIVLCQNKGKVIIDYITDFKQENYLPRFRVGGQWIGKTKIFGIVKNDQVLSKVTYEGKIHYMLINEVVEALQNLKGQNFFVACDPETPDFTADEPKGKLIVCSKGLRFDIPFKAKTHDLRRLVGALYIQFAEQQNKIVIGWNLKSLYSFVLGRLNAPLKLNGKIIDLQIMERFQGIRESMPKTYHEAEKRVAKIMSSPCFDRYKEIYKSIHKPLMQDVIPKMETLGMAGEDDVYHACYEIEGQINGRLRCYQTFRRSFNPHNLSSQKKSVLRSTNPNEDWWMYFDFKSNEVYILQWLSKCPVLRKIIESGGDLYCGIWKEITNQDCNDHYREICKTIFLPVVFGASAKSLCKRIPKMTESMAERMIQRIYIRFPVAMGWVKEQQDRVGENCFACDYFERKRHFDGDLHRVRNFSIQSPAALICLHKLVKLHQSLEDFELGHVAYHVHDGYMVRTTESRRNEVYSVVTEVLESPESLYPGLKLKVGCTAGKNLVSLSPFNV